MHFLSSCWSQKVPMMLCYFYIKWTYWRCSDLWWIHYAVSVHFSILYLFVPFIGRYCKPITSHLYLQQIIEMARPEQASCIITLMSACLWHWQLCLLPLLMGGHGGCHPDYYLWRYSFWKCIGSKRSPVVKQDKVF